MPGLQSSADTRTGFENHPLLFLSFSIMSPIWTTSSASASYHQSRRLPQLQHHVTNLEGLSRGYIKSTEDRVRTMIVPHARDHNGCLLRLPVLPQAAAHCPPAATPSLADTSSNLLHLIQPSSSHPTFFISSNLPHPRSNPVRSVHFPVALTDSLLRGNSLRLTSPRNLTPTRFSPELLPGTSL